MVYDWWAIVVESYQIGQLHWRLLHSKCECPAAWMPGASALEGINVLMSCWREMCWGSRKAKTRKVSRLTCRSALITYDSVNLPDSWCVLPLNCPSYFCKIKPTLQQAISMNENLDVLTARNLKLIGIVLLSTFESDCSQVMWEHGYEHHFVAISMSQTHDRLTSFSPLINYCR